MERVIFREVFEIRFIERNLTGSFYKHRQSVVEEIVFSCSDEIKYLTVFPDIIIPVERKFFLIIAIGLDKVIKHLTKKFYIMTVLIGGIVLTWIKPDEYDIIIVHIGICELEPENPNIFLDI